MRLEQGHDPGLDVRRVEAGGTQRAAALLTPLVLEERQEQVLGADVVVPQPQRLGQRLPQDVAGRVAAVSPSPTNAPTRPNAAHTEYRPTTP